MDGCVVKFDVQDGSSVVFNRIFYGSDGEDDNQGDGLKSRVNCAENRENLCIFVGKGSNIGIMR